MRKIFPLLAVLLLASPLASTMTIAQTTMAQVQADELDKLFAQLRGENARSPVSPVDIKIWAIWLHQGNERENQQLSDATDQMDRANFFKALEMLNALIIQTQNFSEAYNKRATLYFMMGRYDESLSDIVKTLDLEPRHFGALAGRGMIYQKQNRNVEALETFKEALSINPNMPGAKLAVQQLEKLIPEL